MKLKKAVAKKRLVYSVPQAGAMADLNRNASYDAARRGDIPTIRFGKLLKEPAALWDQMLAPPTKSAKKAT